MSEEEERTPNRLEKYMKYVPGSEKIEWVIPMSVLMDPKKNKKLGEPEG